MARTLPQDPSPNKSPVAAVGFVIDAAHAATGRAAVAEVFGEDLAQFVDAWRATAVPFLIAVAPINPTKSILVVNVTERANFPKMLERAIRTLYGTKCAWLIELNEVDRAVAEKVMRDVAERVSYGVSLHDLDPAGTG